MMVQTPALAPVVVGSDGLRVLHAYNDTITILLGGEQTGGKFTMFIADTPPGGGPPPHVHDREDEWFYVLEGSVEFFKDGQWMPVAGPGTSVFMPRGCPHAFRNSGDTLLRVLTHTMPAGIENFFAQSAELFASPDGPDIQKLAAVAAAHGIHIL